MRSAALLLVLALPAAPDTGRRRPDVPLGAWEFENGDARDTSGRGAHGTASGVKFQDGVAVFDGNAHIEIPVRTDELKKGFRTVEIEIRAELDVADRYYSTLYSHPLWTVAVNALGSRTGRPCFTFANVVSDLAPEGGDDPRWGKGPSLDDGTKTRFYYWGWIGDGAVAVAAKKWVTIRFVYDGRAVTQFLDGKQVSTHPIRKQGARVSSDRGPGSEHSYIGNYWRNIGSPTAFVGKIDYVRVRGSR